MAPPTALDPKPDPHAQAIRRLKERQEEQERRLRAIERNRDVLQRRYPR